MSKCTVIGVDLAKSVVQVCMLDRFGYPQTNKALRTDRFSQWLVKQPRSLVAFEACARAHHWARQAILHGHEAIILPPKLVAGFRQGHKTDHNDALAIAVTARQPHIKTVGIASVEQQSLQSDLRVQQHISDQLTATSNLLRSLLAEFGIDIPRGWAALKKAMPWIIEDAQNELPLSVRESLLHAWSLCQHLAQQHQQLEQLLARRYHDHEPCQRLGQLEGVGVKNAIGLYVQLGCGKHFNNGRNAAACIGLTPKQYSSGGKVRIGSIGRRCGNQRLRSSLIVGAHSVINQLEKRPPKTEKERWLKQLVLRRGRGRAAVALANKTVRTACIMLQRNEVYKPSMPLAA